MSESFESEPGQEAQVPAQDEPEYTEVDEARKAHRRLFTLGLLALILAIIAFFFPRCDFSDDTADFGAGTGLTDEQLLALIEENCIVPGETGPGGEQGEPGADGSTGPQGPEGEQGEPGADGSTGPQGPEGEQGICGPIGPAGPQGEAGPAGVQGEPGPRGNQGIQGVQGPRGSTGATGPAGPQGPQGDPGPLGLGDYGSFYDTCTQLVGSPVSGNPNTGRVEARFRFNETDISSGVFIRPVVDPAVEIVDPTRFFCYADNGSLTTPNLDETANPEFIGGSEISFTSSGVYNIQFSAQFQRYTQGDSVPASFWLKKRANDESSFVDIAWSNTHFYPPNNDKSVAVINWFVDVECGLSRCDSFEIWWGRDDAGTRYGLVAVPNQSHITSLSPTVTEPGTVRGPEIPSIILTVNQVGG